MQKTTYYIGLNDKDTKTQKIDTIEAYKIIENVSMKSFGGATISQCKGIFKHEDGTVTIEYSLAVMVIDGIDQVKENDFISAVKVLMNQEAVMVERENVNISFQ